MKNLEKYNKKLSYAYIFGAFGTIEMLQKQPNNALAVLIDPSFVSNDVFKKIKQLAQESHIEIIIDEKIISKIRDKGNIFVIGVFKKYSTCCIAGNHIILYGDYEPGVVGTVIRSLSGFEQKNLILISNNIDLFDEHLVRSSMGAFFNINIEIFESLLDYSNKYHNDIYLISNDGCSIDEIDTSKNYSVIFSNKEISTDFKKIKLSQDIPIENKINIFLFTTYKK